MALEEIQQLFAQFKDYIQGSTFNAPIIINLNSGNAENNLHGNEVAEKKTLEKQDEQPKEQVSMNVICSALNRCKSFMWGNAAYAVAFCVCRDLYGWQDNASLFERQLNNQGVELPIGTINTAISRNAYMRLNVRKWGVSDAMERALKLRDEFKHQMELAAVSDIEA
jgi:hypothetical protein